METKARLTVGELGLWGYSEGGGGEEGLPLGKCEETSVCSSQTGHSPQTKGMALPKAELVNE